MKPLSFLLSVAICLTSCGIGNHAPELRDVYYGDYQLDISGTVPLNGVGNSSSVGMESELQFDETATPFSILTHAESADKVASKGYWGSMPGTIVQKEDGTHFLLFEDKVVSQEDIQEGMLYTYKFILHNGPALLTNDNNELSWTIDMRVEVYLEQELVYLGEAPVTNHAVRK